VHAQLRKPPVAALAVTPPSMTYMHVPTLPDDLPRSAERAPPIVHAMAQQPIFALPPLATDARQLWSGSGSLGPMPQFDDDEDRPPAVLDWPAHHGLHDTLGPSALLTDSSPVLPGMAHFLHKVFRAPDAEAFRHMLRAVSGWLRASARCARVLSGGDAQQGIESLDQMLGLEQPQLMSVRDRGALVLSLRCTVQGSWPPARGGRCACCRAAAALKLAALNAAHRWRQSNIAGLQPCHVRAGPQLSAGRLSSICFCFRRRSARPASPSCPAPPAPRGARASCVD
jgi:hypothetical protein